ncbi:MAG: hypothetical protein E7256_02760 [Lachnospiraceae bacterium]|nr:hypothetical protein [Lachnospiraceae bacterium]
MERVREKLVELLQVLIYGVIMFGGAMFLAYVLCLSIPERDYIPMEAITQVLHYIGGLLVGITICFTNVVSEKMSDKMRIGLFAIMIYALGLTYFSFVAPVGPFADGLHFIGFSIWILTMEFMVGGVWWFYRKITEQKYQQSLEQYQERNCR